MVKMKRGDVPHNGYQALYEGVEGAPPVTVAEEIRANNAALMVVQNEIATYAAHTFATQARRSACTTAQHKVTWFTGNNKCRDLDDRPLPNIAGLAIEVPGEECISPEDDALFAAMQCLCKQEQAVEVVVQQNDGREVRYWSLPVASLYVVAQGCIDSKAMLGGSGRPVDAVQLAAIGNDTRWGIAYGWPNGFDDKGKPKRSQVSFMAFVKELMEAEEVLDDGRVIAHPYNAPFIFHFSSFCTDKIIAVLRSHYRVLDAIDKQRWERGEEASPFYGCALTMKCSRKPEIVGVKPDTSEIYYPVPIAGRVITDAYLASVVISREQAEIVEDNGRVEDAVAWSVAQSRRIILGKDADAAQATTDSSMVVLDDNPF